MDSNVLNMIMRYNPSAASALRTQTAIPEQERVQREVQNLLTRLGAAGVSEPKRPAVTRPLATIMDTVARPGYASMNLIKDLMEGGHDPGGAFMRGLKGQERTLGRDVLASAGVSQDPLFRLNLFKNNLRIAPSLSGILGFGLDILNPVDPLNWIAPGIGKAALTPARKAALAMAKGRTAGAHGVQQILGKEATSKIMGAMDAIMPPGAGYDFFQKLGGYQTPSELLDLIGKKSKQMAKSGLGVDPATVARYMQEGLIKTGVPVTKKLFSETPRALQLKFSAPITHKALGAVEIPGSSKLLGGISAAAEKIRPTGMVQALGKAFVPGFKPEHVPPRVYKNILGLPSTREAGEELFAKALREDRLPDLSDMIDALGAAPKTVAGSEAWHDFMQMAKKMGVDTRKGIQDFQGEIKRVFGKLNLSERKLVMNALVDRDLIKGASADVINAFNMQKNYYDAIVDIYKSMGVDFHPLEIYIPFVPMGPLSREESKTLRRVFGPLGVQMADKWDAGDLSFLKQLDPHLRTRELQAISPEAINRVLGREWLTPDAAIALERRATAFIKGKEATTFFAGLRAKYGIKLDAKVAREWATEKGYALVEPKVQKGGRIRLSMVDMDTAMARGQTEFLALPREFAEAYNDYTDLLFSTGLSGTFGRIFDNITRTFKKISYMWTPGHITRDWASNSGLLWCGDVKNPKRYIEGIGLATEMMFPNLTEKAGLAGLKARKFIFDDFKGTGEQLWDTLREMGVIDTGHYRVDITDTLGRLSAKASTDYGTPTQNILNKIKYQAARAAEQPVYTDVMRDLTRWVDNHSRVTGVLDRLNKGDTLDQAAAFVRKHLFDYSELTPFEQRYMKRVIPFYTWMRKNVPHQIESLLTKPRKFATMERVMRNIGEHPEEGEAPEFLRRSGAVRAPWLGKEGKGTYLTPNLAFADLKSLPTSLEQVRELASSVNPIIRAPVEMLSNRAWYSGRDIEQFAGQARRLPGAGGVKALFELLGKEAPGILDKKVIPQRTLGHILEQIPPLRNIEVMTDPEHQRQTARIASFLGGPPVYPEEWSKEAATYERRDILRELIRMLQQKGVVIPELRAVRSRDPLRKAMADLERRGLRFR